MSGIRFVMENLPQEMLPLVLEKKYGGSATGGMYGKLLLTIEVVVLDARSVNALIHRGTDNLGFPYRS